MGNSLRDVKLRMTATQKTSQITKAMNMVSASKLRKAEKKFHDYKAFMNQMINVVNNIVNSSDDIKNPLLNERKIEKTCYLIITSDRGLAGPYNNSIIKKLTADIEEKGLSNKQFIVSVLGTKGFASCKKSGYEMVKEAPIFVRDDVSFLDISNEVNGLIELFKTKKIDRLSVVYNHYVNTITQTPTIMDILPIKADFTDKTQTVYEYDQGVKKSLDLILPMYVANVIYGLVLESKISEHASRMTAMKSATDNAQEVIETLRLQYNRTRQAAITMELTDIIGGANAIE